MKTSLLIALLALCSSLLFAVSVEKIDLPEEFKNSEIEIRIFENEDSDDPIYSFSHTPDIDSREIEFELPDSIDPGREELFYEIVSGEDVIVEREPLERPAEPMDTPELTLGASGEDLRIDSDVGIGVDDPSSKLHVNETERTDNMTDQPSAIYAENTNPDNNAGHIKAIMGVADGSSTSNSQYTYGILGTADNWPANGRSAYGYGVYGLANGSSSTDNSGNRMYNYGIHGNASGASVVTGQVINYGIYGTASGGNVNWAGYFAGDVNITGDLTVSGSIGGLTDNWVNETGDNMTGDLIMNDKDVLDVNIMEANQLRDGDGGSEIQLLDGLDVNDNYLRNRGTSATYGSAVPVMDDLVPEEDGTYDLGASGLEWQNIYIDNWAYIDHLEMEGNINMNDNYIYGSGDIVQIQDHLVPQTDAGYNLGVEDDYEWQNIYIDGWAYVDHLNMEGSIDMNGYYIYDADYIKFQAEDNYIIRVNNENDYGIYYNATANTWGWHEEGTERAFIDLDNGNFDTQGDVDVGDDLYLRGTIYDGSSWGTVGQVLKTTGGSSGSVYWDDAGGSSVWNESGSDIYYNSGNVGIGTSSPEQLIDVRGSNAWIQVKGTSGSGYAGMMIDRYAADDNGYIHFKTDGTTDWYVGEIGAGGSNSDFAISTSYSPADGKFYIEKLTGNVGIGTTSPAQLLDVDGTVTANGLNINDAYTFPTTAGSDGQVLTTDGLGNVSWEGGGSSGETGTYDTNLPEQCTAGAGASVNFSFTSASTGATGTPTLYVWTRGDIDLVDENWVITGEGATSIGTTGGSVQCGAEYADNFSISTANIDTWAADGTITITATSSPSTGYCSPNECVRMRLVYDYEGGSGGGDNLGNHIATQNLEMSGNWVSNDGGNEGVFVATDGDVGIGTSSPLDPLDVRKSGGIRVTNPTSTSNYLTLETPDAYHRITTTNNFTISSGGTITLDGGNSYIGSSNTDSDDLYLCDRLIDWDSGTYYLDPNGTSMLYTLGVTNYIYDDGSYVRIYDDLFPYSDGSYDLGSSSYEWQDLYIDGTAHCDAIELGGVTHTTWPSGGSSEWYDAGTYLRPNESGEDITPYSDANGDLGTSSVEWGNLYIDYTAYIDALNMDGNITMDGYDINSLDNLNGYYTYINVGADFDMDGNSIYDVDNIKFQAESQYILRMENDDDTGIYYNYSSNYWEWRMNANQVAYIDLDNGNFDTDGDVDVGDDLYLTSSIYIDGDNGDEDQVLKTDGTYVYWGDDETGGGSGSGTYDVTSSVQCITTSGGNLTFNFTSCPTGATGTPTLYVWAEGDLNSTTEYYSIIGEGTSIGEIGGATPCTQCGGYCDDSWNISTSNINTWAADGTITIVADASSGVNTICSGDDCVYMQLVYDYGARRRPLPPEFADSEVSDTETGEFECSAEVTEGDILAYDSEGSGILVQATPSIDNIAGVAISSIDMDIHDSAFESRRFAELDHRLDLLVDEMASNEVIAEAENELNEYLADYSNATVKADFNGYINVNADASHGEIRRGDMLTLSDTPGHARVLGEDESGQLVGIAMENLESGTDRIVVLVRNGYYSAPERTDTADEIDELREEIEALKKTISEMKN